MTKYRENPQYDMLLSVSILILVYFIVLATFFSSGNPRAAMETQSSDLGKKGKTKETSEQACDFMKELIEKRKEQLQKQTSGMWIVVLLELLKKIGENTLRWSFFTLNMFLMALGLLQSN